MARTLNIDWHDGRNDHDDAWKIARRNARRNRAIERNARPNLETAYFAACGMTGGAR